MKAKNLNKLEEEKAHWTTKVNELLAQMNKNGYSRDVWIQYQNAQNKVCFIKQQMEYYRITGRLYGFSDGYAVFLE